MKNENKELKESDIVGLTLEEATAKFSGFGYTVRVTRKNGSSCIITNDYRIDRVNVAIENNIVTAIMNVG